ncbi:MAG: carboxypeptidase-like regulatory domain-containing protein, partial [Balneolaceae bacterium]
MTIKKVTMFLADLIRSTVAILLISLSLGLAAQNLFANQNGVIGNDELVANALENISSEDNSLSLHFDDIHLSTALQMLAREANVGLSYSTGIIPEKKVSMNVSNARIHEILYDLLEGTNLKALLPPSRDVLVIREKEEETDAMFQETVTGQVTDASTDEPLPGVNIVVEGTMTGTTTDADGTFELTVPDLDQTLVVSYIGFRTEEVTIEGRTNVDVELEALAIQGEEMVVTAFGIERETRSLSYSTQSVNTEQISEARELNVLSSLTGRVAGLSVTQGSSGLGADTRVILRGNRSISGDSQPLYVVDG